MAKLRITKHFLDAVMPKKGSPTIYYDDGDVRGFAVQVTRKGTRTFLLAYVARGTGAERRMPIGEYGPYPKLSLAAARERAIELRAMVNQGKDPWLDRKEDRAKAESDRVKSEATLAALIAAYVEHLRLAGKPSAKEVAASFARNVAKPFGAVAKTPVSLVTVEQVMPVFHRLTRAGKWRAAEKLAIYLRAAFALARAARTDAGGFLFKPFRVEGHPLADLRVTRPSPSASSAAGDDQHRKWALTVSELQAYWARIRHDQSPGAALLRVHLLTGGQRMEQLARIQVSDVDEAGRNVTLWDSKGRRRAPRRHVVPLLDDAAASLRALGAPAEGPHCFSLSKGKGPAVPHTVAAAMRKVSSRLLEEGLVTRPITPGAIRRTVETVLGDLGVSRDVRAQLLSHGVSGVQDRHYDSGLYLRQKRQALDQFYECIAAPVRLANVG